VSARQDPVIPTQADLFRRVVNKPARGVGAAALERVLSARDPVEWDIEAACESASASLSAKARSGIAAFTGCVNNARKTLLAGSGDGAKPRQASASYPYVGCATGTTHNGKQLCGLSDVLFPF
jgi:superfamily I DNA/RNA helicase